MNRYRYTFDFNSTRAHGPCIIPAMEVDLEIEVSIFAGQIDANITNVLVPDYDDSMLDEGPVAVAIAHRAEELALEEIKRGGRLFDEIRKREGFELRIPDPSEDGHWGRAA